MRFCLFLNKFVKNRDLPILELRRKEVESQRENFKNAQAKIEQLSDNAEVNNSYSNKNETQCHLTINSTHLEANLVKFWKIEEISSSKVLSPEELKCEQYFKETTSRNDQGRYVVRLSFNEKKDILGESYFTAFRHLTHRITRFDKTPELEQEYSHFHEEYRALNHMSEASSDCNSDPGFYSPHHAVMRHDSLTTKIRSFRIYHSIKES